MFTDKKNLLILLLGTGILFLAYFSYEQQVKISAMDREIARQAGHVQKILLEKLATKKEADSLKEQIKALETTKIESLEVER